MFWTIFLLFPVAFGQTPTPFPPPSCEDVAEFTYVASLNDCRLYYQCIGGTAFQLQCPRGNYFDTGRQGCVPYGESDCPLLTPPPPPAPPTCDDVPEFGYIPSPTECAYYYQCFGGEQWLLKCPRGLYFSFEQQTCVRPMDSDCPLINTPTPTPPTTPKPPQFPTCEDVPNFGYIPSNATCAQYYQCFDNEQWLMQCPIGNYFSFEKQSCVPYGESDCWMLNTTPSGLTQTPPSDNSCEEENCFENIETAPIFRQKSLETLGG